MAPATVIIAALLSSTFIVAQTSESDTCSASAAAVQENGCHGEISQSNWIDDGCFRAAVFENNRVDSEDIGEQIQSNMEIFKRAAKLASENGANMIVFSEDGILMGSRQKVEPYLAEIPDPTQLSDQDRNPCLTKSAKISGHKQNDILIALSCIARDNQLYVVANFGTRQNCEPGEQVGSRECPKKGFLALNTDVVLDPAGNFIRRYYKHNLYIEIFDHSPELEQVYFDTPFGRFGIITCFDILFEKPAMQLVEQHQIDTMLFPTWWYDEAPILSATLSQDAWSQANQVNLLAANTFRPHLGSVGSGIYSTNNTLYTTAQSKSAKLLIANLASKPRSGKCTKGFDPVSINIETSNPVAEYRNKHYELQESDMIFTLQQLEAKKIICNKQVCCTFDYKISSSDRSKNVLSRLVLVVRADNRLGNLGFYEQVCLLASLEKPINPDDLKNTKFSREPLVSFDKLLVKGTFETRFVMPFAGHNLTQPIARKDRHFECHELDRLFRCTHTYFIDEETSKGREVYSFGLYGRMFERDLMPDGWI